MSLTCDCSGSSVKRCHRDFELLGVLTAIAILGKAGAGFVAARAGGMGRQDAAITGVLLNARGLTELIALNVGLQAGIIHQELYTVLVLMAMAVTAATGPALSLDPPENSPSFLRK